MSVAPSEVKRVAIVGTGTIGASWAALFAARGFSVRAMVRNQEEVPLFEAASKDAWARLYARGIAPTAAPPHFPHVYTIEECVADAMYVQESVIEDLSVKQQVIAQIDAACPRGVLIGTSSSFLSASLVSLRCAIDPSRVVTVHPSLPQWDSFVEVFSMRTEYTAWLVELFGSRLSMDVVLLGRESHGHALNAMLLSLSTTSALLVRSGVCDAAGADCAAMHLGKLMYAGKGASAPFIGLIGGGRFEPLVAIATDGYANLGLGTVASAITWLFGHGLIGRALLWLLMLAYMPFAFVEKYLHPMRRILTFCLSPSWEEYRKLSNGDGPALRDQVLRRIVALDSEAVPPLLQ